MNFKTPNLPKPKSLQKSHASFKDNCASTPLTQSNRSSSNLPCVLASINSMSNFGLCAQESFNIISLADYQIIDDNSDEEQAETFLQLQPNILLISQIRASILDANEQIAHCKQVNRYIKAVQENIQILNSNQINLFKLVRKVNNQ